MKEPPSRAKKPTKKTTGLACPICSRGLDYGADFAPNYPGLVCHACANRAVNVKGTEPAHDSIADGGENPVFIDRRKCWRRYRFGGFVTMLDPDDCPTLEAFYERHRG